MDLTEKIVYHAVTERPMEIGQKLFFDADHHSGVYQRVMERLPQVREVYAHPERYQDVKLTHHLSVALRELSMEEVRKADFPQYPSRLSCLFCAETLREAEQWFDFFKRIGRPTFQIVKLRVRGRCFSGNAELCFDGTSDYEENLRLARGYWRLRETGRPPVLELLADGELEVIEIMKGETL